MSGAVITIKKNKLSLELIQNGAVIGRIFVHESNKTVPATLTLEGFDQSIKFSRVKIGSTNNDLEDESIYNKEEFNK